MQYRSDNLRLRDTQTNRLESVGAKGLTAIQSLPRFMDKWGDVAAAKYGVERIINATLNASNRCVIGDTALCGQFCFAHAESNGDHKLRRDVPTQYAREHQALTEAGFGLSVFLSTDTEPLPGKKNPTAEEITDITKRLLAQMIEHPPEGLILHTHTDVSASDEVLPILKELKNRTKLLVGIGFETDTEDIPNGLPAHNVSIQDRLKALETLAKHGVQTQAAVAPLIGFRDFENFAKIFPQIGANRIMVGDLRLDFEIGGTAKARTLKERLGLPAPSQEQAMQFFVDELGYPVDKVGDRDTFYMVTP